MGRSTTLLSLLCALLGASSAYADPRPSVPARASAINTSLIAPIVTETARSLPSVTVEEPPTSATVVFAGDLVPHAEVLDAVDAYGTSALLAPVAPVLRAADLALVNLETPVAASRPVSREQMRFNVHPAFIDALTEASVDAVSSANNHVFDQGVAGVDETVRALRDHHVTPVGAALAGEDPLTPQMFPLAGSTLCVLAATRLLNFDMEIPGADRARVAIARAEVPAEEERFLRAVREARTRCGAVMVSLHAGSEYQERVAPVERAFFRRVAEAGADAVIGHHPHVPLRAEWIDAGGRLVPLYYSLGNLVSNQGANAEATLLEELRHPHVSIDPRTRAGLLAVLRFERRGERLAVASAGYLPLWTVNSHRASPDAPAAHVSAGLMPRDGGGDRRMTRAWSRTLRDADAAMLLPVEAVAGAVEASVRSESVLHTRRSPEVDQTTRERSRRLAVRRPRSTRGARSSAVFR